MTLTSKTRWLVLKALVVFLPCTIRNNVEKRYPGIRNFLDDLRCNEGANSKIGVVGFCWGAYSATRLAHGDLARNGKTLIDAAYTAHPSKIKVPQDIEEIRLPYSMCIGDIDFAMPLPKVQQAAEILDGKKDVDSEVVIIPNAKHGFAVRGNPDDRVEKEMADQAEDQMVRWFAKYLA